MNSVLSLSHFKKALVIISLCLALTTGAFIEQARAETTQQALLNLLIEKLHELQAQLAVLQSQSACPYFPRTMSYEMSGSDVSALQTFLAKDSSIYPERVVNGYYGQETVRAVQRYQYRAGIVRSGSPDTTGYGSVGPVTLAYIRSHCSSGSVYPPNGGDIDGDLSIYSMSLDHTSWDTNNESQNYIRYSVKNTSDESVTLQYRISFVAENTSIEEPDDITGSLTVKANYTLAVLQYLDESDFSDNGDFEVQIEIDTPNIFGEDSESNNDRSLNMKVTGINVTGEEEDDIVLSNLDIDDDSWDVENDSTNSVSFDITNTLEDDEYIEYKIMVVNDDTNVIAQTYRSSVRIKSYETKNIEYTFTSSNLVRDDYEVIIELDPDDDFDESNESNNEDNINFDVTNLTPAPIEVVNLKVNASDTPATLVVNATSTLSWNAQNVNSCFLTINRRGDGNGGYYFKRISVPNVGTRNEKVTIAAPQGALSSVKLECTKNNGGGLLSDIVTLTLPPAVAKYTYHEGAVIKGQTAGLTEYRSLALCLKATATAPVTPWCEWGSKVIYGVRQ